MRMPEVVRRGRRLRRAADEVERPRLGGVAPQEPEALEVGEVSVDGRGRRESNGRADLAHGRRVAVLCGVVVDEREDLALARRELGGGGIGVRTHVRRLDRGSDGVKGGTAAEAPLPSGPHALVAELVDALG